jgi:hypothetical protein
MLAWSGWGDLSAGEAETRDLVSYDLHGGWPRQKGPGLLEPRRS